MTAGRCPWVSLQWRDMSWGMAPGIIGASLHVERVECYGCTSDAVIAGCHQDSAKSLRCSAGSRGIRYGIGRGVRRFTGEVLSMQHAVTNMPLQQHPQKWSIALFVAAQVATDSDVGTFAAARCLSAHFH